MQVFPREIFYPYGWWEQEKRESIYLLHTHMRKNLYTYSVNMWRKNIVIVYCLYMHNIHTYGKCVFSMYNQYVDIRSSNVQKMSYTCKAVNMSVLQCVAVCCCVLQCIAVCCSELQCVAVCCSVLQCVAVCCSVLRRVAV